MLFPISIGLLALAGASLVTALATSYVYRCIDATSAEERESHKAELAAKHLVKELQANNLYVNVESQPQKNWQQSTECNDPNLSCRTR